MKKVIKYFSLIIYVCISISFIFYLILPDQKFPEPPPDSIQSLEKADTENPLRRAYFTNYSREEVVNHYYNQFTKAELFNLSLPLLRLNYPPELSHPY